MIPMSGRFSRRELLQGALAGVVGFGAVAGGAQGVYKARDLLDQHDAWDEASLPNAEFVARHAGALSRLTLGATFAPEQFGGDRAGRQEAREALAVSHEELGIRQVRLGLRWARTERRDGNVDLNYYRPTWDYCLSHDVDVCANLGPIRVFRWPEDHVPKHVLESLKPPRNQATLGVGDPLAQRGFAHLERLAGLLQREYGASLQAVRMLQLENEPFYPMGEHDWQMDQAYMRELADRTDALLPGREILVTTAGRLNLHAVRDLFRVMLREERWQGRLVSGFDFHFRTPKREAAPVLRYFDQITYAHPFAASNQGHLKDARRLGFRIEVTEGQMEPYHHLTSPGNSARDFRYLLLRCIEKVLDPEQPALIRVWGIEELAKKMLRGLMTREHRDIVELFQVINAAPSGGPVAGIPGRLGSPWNTGQ